MRRKKNYFRQSAIANTASYWYYYDRLKELAITSFKWDNLPDTIDERFLELTLFEDGQSVFFKDDVLGFLALQTTLGGRFDVYRIPIIRRAFSSNGYQRRLNNSNSVLIFNNYLHRNSVAVIQGFAYRLWNLDQIIDINANAQKTPLLLIADEKERLTVLNLFKEYDGNAPVIFGDKKLNPNALQVLKTDAPYIADKIYQLKTQIWNEALTYIGISNLNIQKKERLVSDEVNRSLGGTVASRFSRLEARREAVDKINDMFDLDISVDYRDSDELNTMLNADSNITDFGGGEDE